MGLSDLVSMYEIGSFISLIGALSSMVVMHPNRPPDIPVNIRLWAVCVVVVGIGIAITGLSTYGFRAIAVR